MTTKSKFAIAAAVLVLLAGVWAFWPGPELAPPPAADQHGSVAEALTQPARPDVASPAVASERVAATPAPLPPTTGSLLVRVRYADEPRSAVDVPVMLHRPGADFRVDVLRARTDIDGRVQFRAVETGPWEVSSVFAFASKQVEILSGQAIECVLDLKGDLTVVGTVVDSVGAPVAGALVEGGPPLRHDPEVLTTTGVDGTFTLRGCPSSFLIGARAAGYAASALLTVSRSPEQPQHVRLELLGPGGVVEGVVVDSKGAPIASAVVRVGTGRTDHLIAIVPRAPPLPAQVRTDVEGRFRAIGIPVGTQPVQVQAVGYSPWRSSCEVGANLAAELRVTLDSGANCEGRVIPGDGTPAAGVTVRIGSRGEFVQLFALTAADGQFTLHGLPVGEVELAVADRTHGRANAKIQVAPRATVHCDLRLSSGQELRGRVLDETGRPVAGIDIQVVANSDGQPQAEYGRTDSEGRFRVQSLPAGRRVTVVADGKPINRLVKSDVDPAAGELLLFVKQASGNARIRGLVLGIEGKAAASIRVRATCREAKTEAVATTHHDGSFEMGPLQSGEWRLMITVGGCARYQSPVIQVNENAAFDLGGIQLYRGGTLRVTLAGSEAGAVRMTIYGEEGERVCRLSGGCSDQLCPGKYTLGLGGRGIAAQLVPFVIRDGEETKLRVGVVLGISQKFEFRFPDKAPGVFNFEIHRGDAMVLSGLAGRTKHGYVAQRWLTPGDYVLVVNDLGLQGSAKFTVGEAAGPPLVVPVR